MSMLDDARNKINEIDEKMIELFKERMEAAKVVASYKKENNLPIYDPKREEEIIQKNINKLDSLELLDYYKEFFETMLKVSKDYQKKLIK